MKMSSLDLLSELERRLKDRFSAMPMPFKPSFSRFLNFREKTFSLKIEKAASFGDSEPIGELFSRMVEEPQDFYFRGIYNTVNDPKPYPFTLRPSKNFETDFGQLVETVLLSLISSADFSMPVAPSAPASQNVNPDDILAQVAAEAAGGGGGGDKVDEDFDFQSFIANAAMFDAPKTDAKPADADASAT